METNGRDFLKHEIVQVAAVKIDSRGREVGRFERFLKISGTVGATEQIHHISDAQLAAHGQAPARVLAEFAQFIKGCHIVGHNVQFDIDMLCSQMIRCGLPFEQDLCFDDTASISRRFFPQLENHQLGTLCGFFQTQVKADHNAMNDVLATTELLMRMIEEKVRPGEENRRRLLTGIAGRFQTLTQQINTLRAKASSCRPIELIDQIIEMSSIKEIYRNEEARLTNIGEFRGIVAALDKSERHGFHSLRDLLQITALSNTELDRLTGANQDQERIPIITVHQAKGAEFETLFLAGAHESAFPFYYSVRDGRELEERRLFYVALTRAKQKLAISWSKSKYVFSESPYINFLPAECMRRIES